jgi:selenocysteine lyase/cysteine desulfurase
VPERHEAGSPNVVGVHALAVACDTITRHGWAPIVAHERALLERLRAGLATVPGVAELSLFGPGHDRVSVASFTVPGHDAGRLAAVLSAEHGIGVRDGLFCAHIATRRLLDGADATEHRALRASLGLGNTVEHVDRTIRALRTALADGPRWDYTLVDGRWTPDPDPRPLPPFVEAAQSRF